MGSNQSPSFVFSDTETPNRRSYCLLHIGLRGCVDVLPKKVGGSKQLPVSGRSSGLAKEKGWLDLDCETSMRRSGWPSEREKQVNRKLCVKHRR